MLFVRLIASPMLAPNTAEALARSVGQAASSVACVSDADIDATLCSFGVREESMLAAVSGAAQSIGANQAVGRAFRLELQHPDAATAISDESLRAIAVELQGTLRSSVYLTRRTVSAGKWSTQRPMGWGADGLVLGDTAPALPFGGSQSSGVALEAGGPTVIAKARLAGGLSAPQITSIAQACGSPDSGLVELGVYPIGIGHEGVATFVLESSDARRTPLHRALTLLEIEGRRYGARLALGALLSDAPLTMFLDALATNMGLPVNPGQVIETHLPSSAAGSST
jgi:hypothetical protein